LKTYRVNAKVAKFHPGAVLELSAEQFDLRRHNLERTVAASPGRFAATVLSPVEFKTGEIIGVADIASYQRNILEPV
jgi:hypothetical protein